MVSKAAVLRNILAWTFVRGSSAGSPVDFRYLGDMIDTVPGFQDASMDKWDNHSRTAFHGITGWWHGTYTTNGGFCRNFSDGDGYLGCCADVPISFNTSVAIFATQKVRIPMMIAKLEGNFNIKQMSNLTIQVSSVFFQPSNLIRVGGYTSSVFPALDTHGPGIYKSVGGELVIVLGQSGEDTLQLSLALLPWRKYSTVQTTLLPLDLGNCTPSSHWYLPLSTNVDQAFYAFKAVFQMHRGRQTLDGRHTLDEANATYHLLQGTRLLPDGPFTKGAAIPSETELPIALLSQSTTESTSTFTTTTAGTSTFTAKKSLTAQSLVQGDSLNQSFASASNARKDGVFNLVLQVLISCIVPVACCGCIWSFRSRIFLRMHKKAGPQSVNDFVEAARQRIAHDGGNHSESIFAKGELNRLAGLANDERWLLPVDSLVLDRALMPSHERQHVRGTLSGSIRCNVTIMQVTKNDSVECTEWRNEIQISRSGRHPNILLFLGLVPLTRFDATYLGMVHEWIEGRTLEAHVAQRDQINQSTDEAADLRCLLQVAEAMNYLHSLKCAILHCDLRPHNVLIETEVSPPRAKLFNLAKAVQGDRVAVLRGPPDGYVAPEVVNAEPYSPASEVFSFGGICSYVLCGEHPSSNKCEVDALPKLCNNPKSAIDKVRKMCQQKEPATRPTFREVYRILDHGLQNM